MVVFIPGIIAFFYGIWRSPKRAFLDICVPVLFLFPSSYNLVLIGLPEVSFWDASLMGVVAAIFAKPEKLKGRVVGVVGDDLTGDDYARIMTRVLGKSVEYNHIPRETFASFGFPGAEDLANMFEYNRLYIPNRCADVSESRSLYSGMQNFTTWLTANREKFADVFGE